LLRDGFITGLIIVEQAEGKDRVRSQKLSLKKDLQLFYFENRQGGLAPPCRDLDVPVDLFPSSHYNPFRLIPDPICFINFESGLCMSVGTAIPRAVEFFPERM